MIARLIWWGLEVGAVACVGYGAYLVVLYVKCGVGFC